MNVTLNGKDFRLEKATTLAELIEKLSLSGRYAVEVNGQIVPKSAHQGHVIHAGDRIEVVQAIGGG